MTTAPGTQAGACAAAMDVRPPPGGRVAFAAGVRYEGPEVVRVDVAHSRPVGMPATIDLGSEGT